MANPDWTEPSDWEDRYYWWQSGTLLHAQRGGRDPSILYTSTDLADVLEQVGYDETRHTLCPNEAPDLETEVWS